MWNDLVTWFSTIDPVKAALIATIFTWLVTASGASLVFFFKKMHRALWRLLAEVPQVCYGSRFTYSTFRGVQQ